METSSSNIVLNIVNGTVTNTLSSQQTRDQLKQVEYVSFILYLVSFFIGAPANLYVLIGMIRNTLKVKKEVRILLIHLAIADSFVVFILVPTEFVWKITGEWLADEFTCKFLSFFRTFGLFASSFILIAISLDRYFAIKDPLENIDSEKRIKIMLSVCWLMATILSTPQPFIFEVATHPKFTDYHQCMTPIWLGPEGQIYAAVYGILLLIPWYFLPLAVIVFCYSQIYFIVLRRAHDPHIGALERGCPKNTSLELQEMRRRSSGEGTTTFRPVTICSEVQMPEDELIVLVTSAKRAPGIEDSNYYSLPSDQKVDETLEGDGGVGKRQEDVGREKKDGKRKVARKLSFLEDRVAEPGVPKGTNLNGRKQSESKEEERTLSPSEGHQCGASEGDEKRKSIESIVEGNSITVRIPGNTNTMNQSPIEEPCRRNEASSSRRHTTKVDDTRRKVLKMTSLLIIAFVTCWTPYAIVTIWELFREQGDKMEAINKILYFFAVSNSCINPYLYGNLFRFIKERRVKKRRRSGNNTVTTKKAATAAHT